MADRILTWHFPRGVRESPTCYMETDYQPEAVRILAEVAPSAGDLEVDIFVNGVSIFADHSGTLPYPGTAAPFYKQPSNTWVYLLKGETEELDAEDFGSNELGAGSKVTCVLGGTGGAQGITVHLELSKVDEPEEVAE
jgi:hypothetical protein